METSDAAELTALAEQLRTLSVTADGLAKRHARQDPGAPKPASRLERAHRLKELHDLREKAFGDLASMFGDPAFDILLLVYTRTLEDRPISVSGVCTAGDAASTTGLRWLSNLVAKGLLRRDADTADRRRAFVSLTPAGRAVMDRYLDMARW